MQIHAVFAAQPRTRRIVISVLSVGAFADTTLCAMEKGLYMKIFWGYWDDPQNPLLILPPAHGLYLVAESLYIAFVGLGKLFVAICWRRTVGIRQFGPMHILLIIFGQCLVIPCTYTSFVYLLPKSRHIYPKYDSCRHKLEYNRRDFLDLFLSTVGVMGFPRTERG